MEIKFYGASREVGRSCFVVEDNNDRVMLDKGVKLHPESTEYPIDPVHKIDAVVLSHAHLDHSGDLPHLYHFDNPLSYMTSPTRELSLMLWKDTMKIAHAEKMIPRFTPEGVEKALKHCFDVDYNRRLQITDKTVLEFFRAGHIPGAAMSKLELSKGSLLYTGDFRVEESRLFKGADVSRVGEVDVLITESTYGDREHTPRKDTEKRFVEAVQDTLDRKGVCVIPSFALGRSAEIADILCEYKINAPIYMDGMARQATKLILKYPQEFYNYKFVKKAMSSIHFIKSEAQRNKVLSQPSVIITTAGMLQGGPAMFYLPKIAANKNNSVLFVGYQVKDTPGHGLLETSKIFIENKLYQIKGRIEKFDFSAHVGQKALFSAIKSWNPKKVFCVHGDNEVIDGMAAKLKEEGFDAEGPALGAKVKVSL